MRQASVQIDVVAVRLTWAGVADVGVEGMTVIGDLRPPSARLIVPSLPVTPVPATGVPVTGGQWTAQVP